MSHQRKITIRICRRAAYFLFNKSSKIGEVVSDRPKNLTSLRNLITRCYQIS